MRKILFISCVLLALTACEQNSDVSPELINSALRIEDGLNIIEFIEDGSNKTSTVNSFLFTFNTDGSVLASASGQASINGTYNVFQDDGKTELSMRFPQGSVLHELNDEWYFISQGEGIIRFEDGSDEVLVFQQQ